HANASSSRSDNSNRLMEGHALSCPKILAPTARRPPQPYFGFFGVGAAAGGALGAASIGGTPAPAGLVGKLPAAGAGFGCSGCFNDRNCRIASPAQTVSSRSSREPSIC